jgi:hypothetical protein
MVKFYFFESYTLKPTIYLHVTVQKFPKKYIDSTMHFIPVLKELGYMNHELKVDIYSTWILLMKHTRKMHITR